ncbi:NADH-quinone oxidoreductase subunit NuoG [Halorhodospira halochloris]|uniref:NADH-quinone oxidoreductase subunit NuoG n=1 Tax=Halorhodospira halochloris TaxID=1052 RepID=UPI001EE92E84|nr:NADH-quinone oxidoreductase subunit NuoG [Halorhodospira halochloris]MCG5548477.1 NADH-quinone oxidoreductase subunit NuoG [Halorhodospira halochloris]
MSSSAESVDTVTIEIDGRSVEARKGEQLIEAADRVGIHVPRFCYHRHLSVVASCRMCLVEVERAPKLMPACATPVADGMKVTTQSQRVFNAQRGVMEFLLINHPLDCPICDQGGECELQDQSVGYGSGLSRFNEGKRVVADEDLGPLVATEMTRCIHCTRCIRFLDEIAGEPDLGGMNRGEKLQISTYTGKHLQSELSANIVDLCPVGALTNKPFRFRARPWELLSFPAVSPHDGVGSQLQLHTFQGRVVRAVPRVCDTINENWISDRDRFGIEGLNSPQRLANPQVKRDGRWQEIDWGEAVNIAAARLREVIDNHGPESIGGLIAPSATLEELYLGGQLLHQIGSANVDHRLREVDVRDQDSAPVYPYLGQSIADLQDSAAILLIGSYPRHEQPLINHRLRKAAQAGGDVMAINPRGFDWNFDLARELAVAPDKLLAELAGVAQALAEKRQQKLPQHLGAEIGQIKVTDAARDIAQRLLDGQQSSVLLGNLAMSHPQAATLRALGSLIGEWSRSRFGVLAEAANSVGGWLAGALPHRRVGGASSARQGLAADQMLRAGLRAYLLFNVEPDNDLWDPAAGRAALEQADHVVAITTFADERLREVADLLLPAAAFGETAGTYVNNEGAWQSIRGVAKPYAQARPGWRIWRALGTVLELDGFDYEDIAQVHAEIAGKCRDITPAAQYPVDALQASKQATSSDTKQDRKRNEKNKSKQTNCLALGGDVPIYSGDPLVRRSAPLQQAPIAGALGVAVAPQTARQLGVNTDQVTPVRVRANGAALELPLTVCSHIPAGTAWIPAGLAERAPLGPAYGTVTIEAL